MSIWDFQVGDLVFCVKPNVTWVHKKGWVEAIEGYQRVTKIDGCFMQTDISKGWVSIYDFTKIGPLPEKPVKDDWQPTHEIQKTQTFTNVPAYISRDYSYWDNHLRRNSILKSSKYDTWWTKT